jgi:hypothetical protein
MTSNGAGLPVYSSTWPQNWCSSMREPSTVRQPGSDDRRRARYLVQRRAYVLIRSELRSPLRLSSSHDLARSLEGLVRRPASLDHVFGDGCLSDAKPKLEEFAADARSTPKLILRAHLPDQRAQLYLDLRAPSPRARFPTPIAAKADPTPPHQRFRLNNRNAFRIGGNHRYIWTRNQRSMSVG